MLRNSILLVASLLFACVLSESVLRAIEYSNPNFYGPDASTCFTLRAGTEGW